MKNYIIGILVIFAIIGYFRTRPDTTQTYHETASPVNQQIKQVPKPTPKVHKTSAQKRFRSGEQVRGSGTVIRTLSDDNKGSRHQRFIIKLASGQTLLIAHNIDLAQRISFLKVGDSVEFYGVYESNSKGGVIHWTHHDPNNRHEAGWLKHKGRLYQ